MPILADGRYRARPARTDADLRAAQALRFRAFRGDAPGPDRADDWLDADAFDDACGHILVEDAAHGALVCCYRVLPLPSGAEIGRSYAARSYDLSGLQAFPGPMVEMGRFCIDPDRHDADILRVAWAALTRYVDIRGIEMLFGCASFRGTRAADYHDAFALLSRRHLGPGRWLPRVKAPTVYCFAERLRTMTPNPKVARRRMPPLLKTYLLMGGWVSDHAVIDRDLDTLHVFTGLEIGRVPPARAQRLRGLAG